MYKMSVELYSQHLKFPVPGFGVRVVLKTVIRWGNSTVHWRWASTGPVQTVWRHYVRIHVWAHIRWSHLVERRGHSGNGAQLCVMRHSRHMVIHIWIMISRRTITLRRITRSVSLRRTASHRVVVVGGGRPLHTAIARHKIRYRRDRSGTPYRTISVGTEHQNSNK